MNIKIKIGKDKLGKDFVYDFELNPHLLISGCPRPGLVDLLHLIIDQVITNNMPNEIKLVLVDIHRIELSEYENSRYLLYPIIRDFETLPDIYDKFLNGLKLSSQKHFFIIEELSDILRLYPTETEEFIAKVAKSDNAYLVIGAQRPTETVLTDSILQALANRVTFHQNSKVDSERLIGCPNAIDLQCNGEFIHKNIKRLSYGKLDLETESLGYILEQVFASERVGLAHFYSRGERNQTFAIDDNLISPDDDYNLASNCYYSLANIHNKIKDLSELNTPIVFKICEDIALATYLATRMTNPLTVRDILPPIVKRDIGLLQAVNNDEINSLCFSPEFNIVAKEFYDIGKSTANHSYYA